MEIKLDLHTHTSVSPHAYSTLMENITEALDKGLQAIAMTNHGPDSDDFTHVWHFQNMVHIPRYVKGLVVFTGIECSYIDIEGNVDIEDARLEKMDIVIVSKHGNKMGCDVSNFKDMVISGMKNPHTDVLGHLGRLSFEVPYGDYVEIVRAAKANKKLVELNENCIHGKNNKIFEENTKRLILACKEEEVPIIVSSDAHFCTRVGDFSNSIKFLGEIGFDEKLVMNTDLEKFMGYITQKKNIDMLKGE